MSRTVGLSVLALLVVAAAASAMDIVLPDGTKYVNIQLREKSDLGIRVAHASGVTFIDYLSLAPSDQFTFGYDEALYRMQRARVGAPSMPLQQPAATPYSTPSSGFLPKYSPAPPAPVSAGTTALAQVSTPAATPYSAQSFASGQCAATTKKGYRCSRRASASGYCWQHGR